MYPVKFLNLGRMYINRELFSCDNSRCLVHAGINHRLRERFERLASLVLSKLNLQSALFLV